MNKTQGRGTANNIIQCETYNERSELEIKSFKLSAVETREWVKQNFFRTLEIK